MKKLVKTLVVALSLSLSLVSFAQTPRLPNAGSPSMAQAQCSPGLDVEGGAAYLHNYSDRFVLVYYRLRVGDPYGNVWTCSRSMLLAPYATGFDTAGGYLLGGSITNWID